MKQNELLSDSDALELISAAFAADEFRDIMSRLKNGGDTIFCAAISALVTEIVFNDERDKNPALPNRSELLLHKNILAEIAGALALDQTDQAGLEALLQRNSFEIQRTINRSDEYLTEIIMRLSSGSDQLFVKIISKLAAMMLVNVEQINTNWEKIFDGEFRAVDDPKKMPN